MSRLDEASLEQAAFVHILKAHGKLDGELVKLLKPFNLSEPQYNVLRILRGAPEGLPCQAIAARMITRLPDITRLLDRLEASDLVARERPRADRRIVLVSIRTKGLTLLSKLDDPVRELHRRQFRRLPRRDLNELVRLLVEVQNTQQGELQ
jgi:DNA-binding MarR family transcriptional regulator